MLFTMKLFFTFALLICTVFVHSNEQIISDYSDAWGEHGISLEYSTRSGVSLNFSIRELELVEDKLHDEIVHRLLIPGVFLPNDEGAPNLPIMSRYIALPQGAKAELKIVSERTEALKNINIEPAPRIPAGVEDGPLEYNYDMSIYSRDEFFPQEPVFLSEQTDIRGLDVVIISITPFQYNPVSKELLVYRDLKIEVDFVGGSSHFGDDRLRNRWFDPILFNSVINPEQIPHIDYSSHNTRDEGYEYLVIVPDDPEFIAWGDSIRVFRSQQGIKTEVVTTAEVGGNDHVMIKNYISNAYDNWDIPPVAVLLLADYGTTGNTITSEFRTDHPTSQADTTYISDHYYSDMNDNLMPDIIPARITAQNRNDLETMVGKFINYERNPPTNTDYYNEPITAMGWQTERWFQISAESVNGFWEHILEKNPLRQNAIYGTYGGHPDTLQYWSTNDNTPMVMNVFGPDGLGYIPDNPQHLQNYGWDADDVSLNNAINSGAFMVMHRDHGDVTGWGKPYYRNDHLDGLNNDDLPFVFSINCLTGRFHLATDCFAEAIHKHQYGALGIIAASAISYSFVNDAYTWGMFNHMWPDFLPQYGTNPVSNDVLPAFANAAGKYFLQQSSWPTNPDRKEITYRIFHHHGDAFSHVFTEVPQPLTVLHDQYIFDDEQHIIVTADQGAFISLFVNGEIIATAEATGQPLNLSIGDLSSPDVINLTVTKQNYSRYDAKIGVVSFAGGAGTSNDPFQIATHSHLYSVRYFCNIDNIYFELIDDIDLTAEFLPSGAYYNFGNGWEPIGDSWSNTFEGTFDGADYQIKGLYINNDDSEMQGLFGNIEDASILNIGITNADITGSNYVGSLVGRSYNSSISDCYSVGAVKGNSYVGGLVGQNLSNSIINKCFSIGTTSGHSYVGGLVGENYISSNVINSYSTGNVTSTGNFIGGLVGNNFQSTVSNSFSESFVYGNQFVGGLIGFNDNSEVNNSYSKGNVNGSSSVGGLIGRNWYNSNVNNSYSTGIINGTSSVGGLIGFNYGNVNSCYWDIQTSGQTTSSGGIGRETDEMTYPYAENTYSGWNFVDVWSADNEYYINQGYPYLIEMGTYEVQPIGEGTSENPYRISSFSNLTWIANDVTRWDKYYVQTNDINASQTNAWYDGEGWIPIGNHNHHFTGNYYGGGYTIIDLHINRPDNDYQGLFGYANNATIKNLSLIDLNINGHDYVGGLIGNSHQSYVKNCYTSGNVQGNWWVGGISGRNNSFSSIQNSSSISSVNGVSRVGGIIGSTINYSSLKNSYSTGEVSASDGYLGGLVGYNYFESLILNCYSIGLISGSGSYVGGLVGRNQISSVTNSYWNIETSGQTTSDAGEGRTTEEMSYPYAANTYVSWDFEEVWVADQQFININDGYPYHMWWGFGLDPLEGDGTIENPYQIDNIAHLIWIGADVTRWDKHYIQTSNIDASVTTHWDDGWKPIGNHLIHFTGTYNGNGFMIDGLFIDRQHGDYQGLFGYIREATITNLSLVNIELSGKSYVGGLAGYNDSSLISSCYTKGNVSGLSYVGGLVGYNFGTIKECFSRGFVNGNDYLGGLIGSNSSSVDDSYSRCNVTGNSYIGGLIGSNFSTVNNSFSTGIVSGNYIKGGLIALNTGTVNGSYWDIESSGIIFSEAGEGRITKQMIFPSSYNTFQGWDYDDIWIKGLYHSINDGYPHLKWQGNPPIVPSGEGTIDNPYIVESLGNLYWIYESFNYHDHYKQITNIDASDTFYWTNGGWKPIGSCQWTRFRGTYDGNGFTIDGLYINRNEEHVGLFGNINEATISNLGITNANISNGFQRYTGSLVGRANSTTISNCFGSNNNVTGTDDYVGGLVGYFDNSSILNSYYEGSVSANERVGGLIGHSTGQSSIINCYSSGVVQATGEGAGGLTGWNYNASVMNSYSKGSVTGVDHVGGLIGNSRFSSEVVNCYSTAAVSGQEYVGGLLGEIWSGEVHNSYSTGSVLGTGVHVGGLVGRNYDNTSVTYSYWNTETSGQTTSVGGFGRTTEHMTYPYSTHSYVDWNFTDVWANDYDHEFNNGYPILSHEVVIDEFPWTQDFSNIPVGHIPAGWSRTHSNWFVTNSSYAGGEAPEVKFYYHPSTTGVFRLITPPISLDDVSSFNLSFKHWVAHNQDNYSLRVQTSSDKINWDTVWEINPTGYIGPETVDLFLSDLLEQSIYIAWVFYGNSSNIINWNIDDILLEKYDLLSPTNLEAVGGDEVVYLSWEAPETARTEKSRDVLRRRESEHILEIERSLLDIEHSERGDYEAYSDTRLSMARRNDSGRDRQPNEFSPTESISHRGDLVTYSRNAGRERSREISYNIYRDGSLIGDSAVNSYTDYSVINGTPYSYYVTAVYDEGESQPSNTVTVTPALPLVIDEFPWHEDFSETSIGEIPDGWMRTHTNWKVNNSAHAGGFAPEMIFVYSPISTNVFRLISPKLNLHNMNKLEISFNHMVNHYTGEYSLKVQISPDLQNWDTVWEIVPEANIEAESVELIMHDLNENNLHIAWVFEGYSWNINYWCLDEINVMATHMMAGDYTIKSDGSGDYNSFNQAVDDLIEYGITEAVEFTVSPGIYQEQIAIPEILGTSETNTITFTGVDSEIEQTVVRYAPQTSADRYVVRLNGTKHIRFENLTMEIIDTTDYGWVIHLMSDCEDVEITNCLIYTQTSNVASDYAGIVISGSESNLITGASNVNDVLIENNTIIGGYAGVYLRGVSEIDNIGELQLLNNTIINNHFYGISISYSDSPIIKNNEIGIEGITNAASISISLSDIYGSFELSYNYITDIGSIGVLLFNTDSNYLNPSVIYNNMIGDFSQALGYGMMLYNCNYLNILYNSINLNALGAADVIYIDDNTMGLRVLNNSFAYTGNDNGRAAYYSSPSSLFEHDFNNYYTGTSDLFVYYGGEIPDLDGLQAVNLPAGNDQNSHVGYPGYNSETGLHTQNIQLWQKGTPINGITDDIDGDIRDSENPCIGADEFSPLSDDLAAMSIVGSSSPFINEDNVYQINVQNAGVNTQDYYTVKLMKMENRSELASIIVSEPLLSGDTTTHSLSWTPTEHGDFDLYGKVVLAGDENPQNDYTKILPVTIIPVSVPYYEDFSDIAIQTIPVGWARTHANWGVRNTNNAGGEIPEMQLERVQTLTDLLRLSTVLLDVTNVSNLSLSFKHFLDEYSHGSYSFTIKLQTSTDGTNWNDLETIAVRNGEAIGDIGPETYTVELDGLVGDTFYVGWVFDGEISGINKWNIDDVGIAGVLPPANLAAIARDGFVELSWDAPGSLRNKLGGERSSVLEESLYDSNFESDHFLDKFAGSEYVDTGLKRSLQGYNIYRDGDMINAEPIVETTYIDTDVVNGVMYSYYVTAVYSEGESGPSNTVEVIPEAQEFAGGSGTQSDPWQIETAEQLGSINNYLGEDHSDKHFELINDIDMTAWFDHRDGNYFDDGGWIPIGIDYNNPFKGSFDGNNYIIDGLYINRADSDFQGLFGYIEEATITNLGVINVSITGHSCVGALVGESFWYASVTNCFSTGIVTGEDDVGGLIGAQTDGTNLNNSFSDCNVNGDYFVGGLVGYGYYETLSNNYSRGYVTGNAYVGGLVGFDGSSQINNCYSTGILSGNIDVGGLVGHSMDSIIENSYWDIQSSGINTSDGGEGRTTAEMTYPYVDNTYVDWDFATIWSSDDTYSINSGYPYLLWQAEEPEFAPPTDLTAEAGDEQVILNWQPPQTVMITRNMIKEDRSSISHSNRDLLGYNVYRDGDMINADPIAVTTYTDDDVVNSVTYSYYVTAVYSEDESGASNIVEATPQGAEFAGGSGTESDPWQIVTHEHLNNVRNYLGEDHSDKHFILMNDIDLSDEFEPDGAYYNNGEGWEPLGDYDDDTFYGNFDGLDNTISGLIIARTNEDYIGLFGYTENTSNISNLILANVNISGNYAVGALVGENYGTISNCYSSGTVEGMYAAGGLVGSNEAGSISYSDSSVNVSIIGWGEWGGGLVGYNYSTISNSFATGEVTSIDGSQLGGLVGWQHAGTISDSYATGSVEGSTYLGGLVGYGAGNITNSYAAGNVIGNKNWSYSLGGFAGAQDGNIVSCYASGDVTGEGYLGGLVGENWGDIDDSYALGTVTGDQDWSYDIGGLIGYTNSGIITNCYSIGQVISDTGYETVGGMVGNDVGSAIIASYWNTETSSQPSSDGGEGRTTAEMTYPYADNTYIDWDFATIWSSDEAYSINNGYPYLLWQAEEPEFAPPTDLIAEAGDEVVVLNWQAPQTVMILRNMIKEDRSSINHSNRDLLGYNVYRDGDMINADPIAVTTYTDDDVVNSVTYSYYVTAVYAAGESEPSNTVAATPLARPQNLSAEAGDSIVNLSWDTPPTGTILGYNVYRDDVQINIAIITETEYADTDVINSTTYSYYVTAVYDIHGESVPSDSVEATPLAAPTDLTANYGDLYIELNWIAAGDGVVIPIRGNLSDRPARNNRSLQGYNLYRDGVQINSTIISETEYTDTDVEYDTNYSYYVTAVYDVHGESVPSNTVEIYVPDKVAAPTFSPEPGLYTEATDVTIETATENATIMYRTSTDGGAWSDWEVYTDPVSIPLYTEMDFEAYAEKDDWITSETAFANYIVTGTVATPTFTPEPGIYTDTIDVAIEVSEEPAELGIRARRSTFSDRASIASKKDAPRMNQNRNEITIYYRTSSDSGAWSDWEIYTTPINVPLDTEMDFEAYAEKDDWITSETVSANYIVTGSVADPTFLPEPGLYTEETDVTIETDTENATIMYRSSTDGSAWTDWEVYTDPITVSLDTEMDYEAYAEKDDWITSETVSANYIVTGSVADPNFLPEPGLYTEETDVTIETDTEDATVMYRTSTDGGAWTDWQVYTDPITVSLDTEMDFEAYAEKDDWITSETMSANYIVTGTVENPTFLPEPGFYTEETDVTIETDTENATIMYRSSTDGSAWTVWEVYTDPITVSLDTEMDFEAYAEKDDWITSETMSTNYIVTGTVENPTFLPEPGFYTVETDVTIETDTENATIMYRSSTDGGTWTDWEVYTDPITVSLDTEMDFEAYAEKDDWITSETMSANYIVTGTVENPTFLPEPGFYTEETDVTIETVTEAATIMYRTSTDGGTWTDWEVYTDPITVSLDTEMDFEAYAEKDEWITSETVSANYVVTGTVATPEFEPEGDVYLEAQTVTITTATTGATIEYSFDGEEWIEGDTAEIEYTTMLYARAYLENWLDSEIAEAMYYILNPPQELEAEGLAGYVHLNWQEPYSGDELILTARNRRDNPIRIKRQIIDRRDSDDLIGYNIYRQQDDEFILLNPEPITQTEYEDSDLEAGAYTYHVTAIYEQGESNPSDTATATVNMAATPEFSPEPGYYDEAIELEITTETEEAEIYFTLDGSEPTHESLLYTEPVILDSTVTVKARAFKEDWLPSEIAEALYEIEITDAEDDIIAPIVTSLGSAYPNPFNPETTIPFSLSNPQHVSIAIYNIRGQKVRELVDTEYEAGHHQIIWNGRDERSRQVSSGVYFCIMQTGEDRFVSKVVMMK
jgi:hypothetical protein